jgi:hypothetical protein
MHSTRTGTKIVIATEEFIQKEEISPGTQGTLWAKLRAVLIDHTS